MHIIIFSQYHSNRDRSPSPMSKMQEQLTQITSMVQEQQSLLRSAMSFQNSFRGEQLELSNRLVVLEEKTASLEGAASHCTGKKN